jgi:hypothetical protein
VRTHELEAELPIRLSLGRVFHITRPRTYSFLRYGLPSVLFTGWLGLLLHLWNVALREFLLGA